MIIDFQGPELSEVLFLFPLVSDMSFSTKVNNSLHFICFQHFKNTVPGSSMDSFIVISFNLLKSPNKFCI